MFKDISKLFKFTVHEELGIEVPEGVKKFQNFSSLQFMLLNGNKKKRGKIISKLFKFTVHNYVCKI